MKVFRRSRDKGKTIPGQLIKGSSQPRMTAPSIPCKNSSEIQYKQPEKAFGITSQRFQRKMSLQSSIGPGSYDIQNNPERPSFSKKGFGSMVSENSRNLGLKYNRGPGPADYSRTQTSFFNKQAKKRATRFPQADNPGAFWSQTHSKANNPGPFQYNQMQTTRSSNISSSSFKSSIKRWKDKISEFQPNPSTYHPNESLTTRRSRGIIIQKDKPISKQAIIQSLFGRQKQLNGPGEHFKQKSSIKPFKSTSVSGFRFANQSIINLNKMADVVSRNNYKQFLQTSLINRSKRKSKDLQFAKMTF